ERVAVLYNLKSIGGKDWYRWAAQMLVGSQQPRGNWQDGGYHGAHPTLDTCLALLVLKRANLVEDLGKRLPIDPRKLDRAIRDEPTPPPRENPPAPLSPRSTPPVTERPPAAPASQPSKPAVAVAAAPVAEEKSGPRRWPLWLALVLGSLALLGGGLCVILYRRRGDEEPGRKPRARAKPPRKARAAAP